MTGKQECMVRRRIAILHPLCTWASLRAGGKIPLVLNPLSTAQRSFISSNRTMEGLGEVDFQRAHLGQ
jgi:hypothetical protein